MGPSIVPSSMSVFLSALAPGYRRFQTKRFVPARADTIESAGSYAIESRIASRAARARESVFVFSESLDASSLEYLRTSVLAPSRISREIGESGARLR